VSKVEAQWRVLEGAFDELNLWDLPGRHGYSHSGGRSITPDLTLDDVRDALVSALHQGLVELYDSDAPSRPLALDDALGLVARNEEWGAESFSRMVELAITPAGVSASQAASTQRQRASPFLAAGSADPNIVVDEDDPSS
jgi:hypothetical protein